MGDTGGMDRVSERRGKWVRYWVDYVMQIRYYSVTMTAPQPGRRNVRLASERDAAACAAIYAPYVADTAITFEIDPPSAADMAERIGGALRTHAWVVLEEERRVIGYAYGSRFHPRAAYRWACETSVFLEPGRRRTGGGRALYNALLPRLAEREFRIAVAGMTLPNDASVGLHRAMGFDPVGTYRQIGFKHAGWHDVAWTQCILAGGDDPPPEPM